MWLGTSTQLLFSLPSSSRYLPGMRASACVSPRLAKAKAKAGLVDFRPKSANTRLSYVQSWLPERKVCVFLPEDCWYRRLRTHAQRRDLHVNATSCSRGGVSCSRLCRRVQHSGCWFGCMTYPWVEDDVLRLKFTPWVRRNCGIRVASVR